MTSGITLQRTLSRAVLAESSEQQLLYVLLEATPEGAVTHLPKLPLNLCLVIDRSSSMRGDRLSQVKEAANRIIDQLEQSDFFSLITFNDRAEVVIQATRVTNRVELKQTIARVEAAGGTEMARGMALALQEVQRPLIARGISRIMLLTDGRTYGDESTCVEIARRAQSRNIGLTALGIGTEWNEDLLETMTASENSRAKYITSAQEVVSVFTEELRRMHSVFAQRVRISAALRPGGMLRSLDQVRPFIASLPVAESTDREWESSVGDWTGADVQGFLLELVVPPLPVGEHPLLKITLRYDLPGAGLSDQVREEIVRISVRSADQAHQQVDGTVKHWLERLMAYRLQARAWKDVEAGRIDEATHKLQMAGTRLFSVGEHALAQTLQEEGTRLLRSGATSEEGRKRIKFGTRGLMGPTPTDERAAGE
ncbi:MAG: VWA domain-containing protein [Roseiflexaceae bacterium]